jgi:hypothetical protein
VYPSEGARPSSVLARLGSCTQISRSSGPAWLTIQPRSHGQVSRSRLAYAPELNPVEGAWANMKNGLGNLMARDVDQLAAIIKNRLKRIQYRPAVIDGFLAQTGLTLDPQPP